MKYEDRAYLAIETGKKMGFKQGKYPGRAECEICGKEYDWASTRRITRHWLEHNHYYWNEARLHDAMANTARELAK